MFAYEPQSRNFKLRLGDKWANYYDGEQTQISLKLKKDRKLWGDEQILSKEMLLPAQGRYEVDFADFVNEFSKPLESGQKYYVEWSFRRVGSVSKPVNNEGGQTFRLTLP